MRFIIREQEYERLLAAGRLNYRSGVLESWRLTAAVDGFRVLRIDLDRRSSAASGSTLVHMLLDSNDRLERLKLRDFSLDASATVDILAEGNLLIISRNCKGGVVRDEFTLPSGFGLLLPTGIGLALFVRSCKEESVASALSLDVEQCYAPSLTSVEINPLDEEKLTVTGQTLAVRPYLIRQDEMRRTIWLDEYGLPVRLDDHQGRQAIEDRYVRHH